MTHVGATAWGPTATVTLAVLLATTVGGASACSSRRPVPKPPDRAVDERAAVPPGLFVLVSKSKRTLTVYRDGEAVARFRIVLGARPVGPKRFEGDMRTPEGLYHVVEIRRHPRWRYFIALDYPNHADRQAYKEAVAAGLVPKINRRPLGIGGAIGIHGSDHPREQAAGIDWTKGCIALDNEDVARLAALLKPGTPVRIEP